MDWAEIDTLLWLYIVLKLIDFGVHALVAWMTAKGWIGSDLSHGVFNVIR